MGRQLRLGRVGVHAAVRAPAAGSALALGLLLAAGLLALGATARGDEPASSPDEFLSSLIPGEAVPEGELEGIYGRGVNIRALGLLQQEAQETFSSVVSTTASELHSTRFGEFSGESQGTTVGTSVGAPLRAPTVGVVRRPGTVLGTRSPATTRSTTFRSPNGNILGGGAHLRGVTRTPAAASSIGLRRGF